MPVRTKPRRKGTAPRAISSVSLKKEVASPILAAQRKLDRLFKRPEMTQADRARGKYMKAGLKFALELIHNSCRPRRQMLIPESGCWVFPFPATALKATTPRRARARSRASVR